MPHYYLNDNAQANGDHEVHTGDCSALPMHRYVARCQEAVIEARKSYPKSNGCYYCSREGDTG